MRKTFTVLIIALVFYQCTKTKTNTVTQTNTVTKTDTVRITNTVIDTVFSSKYQIEIRGKILHGASSGDDTLFIPKLTAGVISTSTVTVLIEACPPTGPYSITSNPSNNCFPQDTLHWSTMPFNAAIGNSIL